MSGAGLQQQQLLCGCWAADGCGSAECTDDGCDVRQYNAICCISTLKLNFGEDITACHHNNMAGCLLTVFANSLVTCQWGCGGGACCCAGSKGSCGSSSSVCRERCAVYTRLCIWVCVSRLMLWQVCPVLSNARGTCDLLSANRATAAVVSSHLRRGSFGALQVVIACIHMGMCVVVAGLLLVPCRL